MGKFDIFGSDKNQSFSEEGFSVDTDFADSLPNEEPLDEPDSVSKQVVEWVEVLSIAIIAVVIIFCLVFRVATISGDSMKNTLIHNDKVIITNLGYEPKQGDIVVISRNAENSIEAQNLSNEPIIKRVIAVGGQTVNIDFEQGIVYVDGVALEEDYILAPTVDRGDVQFPLYIPEGSIFVLGDNRPESLDSRYSQIGVGGIIDERYVLGHAVFRIFPFNKIGRLD
jgi:signal peptidase I